MGTETRAHFFSFKMGNAESVIEIEHRFGEMYTKMAIQGMPEPDEVKARVLMTYPSDRWGQYVDNIAIRSPAPTIAEIFAGMKMLEERQNAWDEAEHGEASRVRVRWSNLFHLFHVSSIVVIDKSMNSMGAMGTHT